MLKKLASPDACILTALKGNCFYACGGDAEGGMGWSPSSGCPPTHCTCNTWEATSTLFGACSLATSAFALINLCTTVSHAPWSPTLRRKGPCASHISMFRTLSLQAFQSGGGPILLIPQPIRRLGSAFQDPHVGTGQEARIPPRYPRRNLQAESHGAPGHWACSCFQPVPGS